jgi:hypothetical protein
MGRRQRLWNAFMLVLILLLLLFLFWPRPGGSALGPPTAVPRTSDPAIPGDSARLESGAEARTSAPAPAPAPALRIVVRDASPVPGLQLVVYDEIEVGLPR